MSLQVRLRHSLGTRIFDLPERSIDDPILVGRAATCQVQVPSTAVGENHCMLFVHEGAWVVQDAGTPAGTFVNGQRVEPSAFFQLGDVITLGHGSKAPALEIDPMGIARAAAGRPATARGATVVPAAVSPQPVTAAEPADDAWPVGTSAPTLSYASRPRKQQGNQSVLLIGILLTVLIVGGGVVAIFLLKSDNAAPRPPVQVAAPTTQIAVSASQPATRPKKPRPAPATDVATAIPEVAPATQVVTATTQGDDDTPPKPPVNPLKDTKEWRALEDRMLDRPENAVVALEQFMRDHADSPLKADLDAMLAEQLDRLWIRRIEDLFEKKKSVQDQIDEIQGKLADATDAAFKKARQTEIAKLQEQMDRNANDLTAAGCKVKKLPVDATQDFIRATRDADKYADWKEMVLNSIRRTRELPWGRSR